MTTQADSRSSDDDARHLFVVARPATMTPTDDSGSRAASLPPDCLLLPVLPPLRAPVLVLATCSAMDSVLEAQRSKHEERERIEDTLVREMMAKKTTVSPPSVRLSAPA